MTAVFIFRRDLRLQDNPALSAALKTQKSVLPLFIFDPRQIENHGYFSGNGFRFLYESLKDLHNQLLELGSRLYVFYGAPEKVLEDLYTQIHFDQVFVTRDYTPFSLFRDKEIEHWCKDYLVGWNVFEGLLLNAPEDVFKGDRTPYTVFTPFRRKAEELEVLEPFKVPKGNWFAQDVSQAVNLEDFYKEHRRDESPEPAVKGGRTDALKQLKVFLPKLAGYSKNRDIPSVSGTSLLSAHLKFGTISPREIYHQGKKALADGFINELYWRDFFTHIGFHFPHVYGGKKNFRKIYDGLEWNDREEDFLRWCEGRTGFPIVDAGMRELNVTGYMHNRVRMITASFLVKDLMVDWRKGERYFAQKLIDYDPAVNNGNWQWAASTGCDAQPYFRIFNPWRQQERFDPEAVYIKKWIPELLDLAPKEIHSLATAGLFRPSNYPAPMIDHALASQATKVAYKRVNGK